MDYETEVILLDFWLKGEKNVKQTPPELKGKVDEEDVITIIGKMGYNLTLINILNYKRDLERDKRDKDIIKVQQNQEKIINKQTFFTELVALASIIIGTTAVIEIFGLQLGLNEWSWGVMIFQYFIHVVLGVAIVFLMIDTTRYAWKKYPLKK